MSHPCQPYSSAGKGDGFADERHTWPFGHHLIGECRPAIVLGEQVASKDGLAWLDLVQADLEGTGYACGAHDICAAGFGAPNIRQRQYFLAKRLANSDKNGRSKNGQSFTTQGNDGFGRDPSISEGQSERGPTNGFWRDADWLHCRDGKWRPVEPGTFPLVDGSAFHLGSDSTFAGKSRKEMLKGYGNALNAQTAINFCQASREVLAESNY